MLIGNMKTICWTSSSLLSVYLVSENPFYSNESEIDMNMNLTL